MKFGHKSHVARSNVWIGTTSPAALLDVEANSSSSAIFAANSGSSGQGVEGSSTNIGVYGVSSGTGSGTAAGVYGINSPNGSIGMLGYNGFGVYCFSGSCGGNATWTNTSDARLKTAFRDLPDDDGLSAIMKLRPVHFHWKDRERDKELGERIGFIAQEVEKVIPEVVTTGGKTDIPLSDGSKETIPNTKSLSYAEFVVPLVKATQELRTMFGSDHDLLLKLQTVVEADHAEIIRLRSVNADLQQRLTTSKLGSEPAPTTVR